MTQRENMCLYPVANFIIFCIEFSQFIKIKFIFCNVVLNSHLGCIPNHFLHLGCKIFKSLGCLVLTERKLCRFTSQKVSFICYMMTLIKVKKETPTDKC